MLSMVFEVIQPDLEINRRHAATLPIPPTGKQCAGRFGHLYGGIRANSGSGTAAQPSSGYGALLFLNCSFFYIKQSHTASVAVQLPVLPEQTNLPWTAVCLLFDGESCLRTLSNTRLGCGFHLKRGLRRGIHGEYWGILILETSAEQPQLPGLLTRVRRAWARDSHLSVYRRVQKGIGFARQLIRAHFALKSCTRVGVNARVAGRMRVENHGVIVIGDYLNINSSWVPTELITGRDGRIEIGNDVAINYGTVIAAGKGVTIGSGTMLGQHCIISDLDIPETAVEPGPGAPKPIKIGRDVWLAARVTVRPGVMIGDGAVVVAGSIVESDVPAHVMASGIPARLLPKLADGARPVSNGNNASDPAVVSADGTANRIVSPAPPVLRGNLISDFSLDELAHELAAADVRPVVDAAIVAWTEFPQSLTLVPRSDVRDFCVVWTRPEAAVPTFARLLVGDVIDERQLTSEVDGFCGQIEQCAANYRYVLLPTWTEPVHLRGQPLIDGRPGGVLSGLSAMNFRLLTTVGRRANVFVLDAARWQAAVGPVASNPRAWYLGHMAMARPLIVEAARDIRAALGALYGRQRMLLVLDSEDAFWGGSATESIDSLVPIAHAYADFQLALRLLKRRGVLLALLGNTGESHLFEVIRHRSASVLREDDFMTCGMAGDEIASIAALATRLGVSLESVVYIGAQETVRTRVRAALPAVYVPDWPSDKLLFPSALQGLRCFDAAESVVGRTAAAQ
jgi:acetyltransferase-like isoleucine patch superfamily enzyme